MHSPLRMHCQWLAWRVALCIWLLWVLVRWYQWTWNLCVEDCTCYELPETQHNTTKELSSYFSGYSSRWQPWHVNSKQFRASRHSLWYPASPQLSHNCPAFLMLLSTRWYLSTSPRTGWWPNPPKRVVHYEIMTATNSKPLRILYSLFFSPFRVDSS